MAKEYLQLGNEGLQPLFYGDINRAQADPNVRIATGFVEGVFNPFRVDGFISPANQSYKEITFDTTLEAAGIAQDATSSHHEAILGVDSVSFAHTCTGSNGFLIVAVAISSTSDVSAIVPTDTRYGGGGLQLLGSQATKADNTGFLYFYGLLNPPTGSNNFNFDFPILATGTQTDTYTANDTWTAPAGVTSVTVECWGAGGGGATDDGGTGDTTTGGGGGGYSKKLNIAVTPAGNYTVTVGVGGTGGTAAVMPTAGGDSWFLDNTTVLAKGGSAGDRSTTSPVSGGAGGAAGSGIGDTKFSGGRGGNVTSGSSGNTGGGGGAGDAANGANGTDSAGTTDTAGGAGGTANGGNGGAGGQEGVDGSVRGGGGGAGRNSSSFDGGSGGRGEVRITYSVPISVNVSAAAVSYTGVLQSVYPTIIQESTESADTAHSISVTSTADNSFIVGAFASSEDHTADANTSLRVTNVTEGTITLSIGAYINNPKTPAGAQSIGWTQASSEAGVIAIAFAPAVDAVFEPLFPRVFLSDNTGSVVSDLKSYMLDGQHLWHATSDSFTQFLLADEGESLGGNGSILAPDMLMYYLNNETQYPFIISNKVDATFDHTLLDSSEEQKWTITDAAQTGLDFTNEFTIAMRIYLKSFVTDGASMILVDKFKTSGDQRAWSFRIQNSGGVFSLIALVSSGGTSGSTNQLTSGSFTPILGEWTFVAVTFSGPSDDNEVRFFLNGNQLGATSGSGLSSNLFNSNAGVGVGGQADTSGQSFNGAIADVRLWSEALSNSQINDLYFDPAGFTNGANLEAWWEFNGDGTDSSANNNDLTAQNFDDDDAETASSISLDRIVYYNASTDDLITVVVDDLGLDDFGNLAVADNGFMYVTASNHVHKFDGTSTGGANGILTKDVLLFPEAFRTRGSSDYRGYLYIGVVGYGRNPTSTSANSYRFSEVTDTIVPRYVGVYVWDRLSSVIRMRDFIKIPNLRDIGGLHESPQGTLRCFGITNNDRTVLLEYTGSNFNVIADLGAHGYPSQPRGVGISGLITYWIGQDGYYYAYGRTQPNGKDVLAKVLNVNEVATSLAGATAEMSLAGANLMGGYLNIGQANTANRLDHEAHLLGFHFTGTSVQIFTVTIASPGVFTKTAHGLASGDKLVFSTTGALPTGLTAGTTYYVISSGLTSDAFQVSTSFEGSAVNTSGSQSGVHTYVRTKNNAVVRYFPHTTEILQSVTPVANQGNLYTGVLRLPVFANIQYIRLYNLPISSSGSDTIATIKLYKNHSSTVLGTYTVSQKEARDGYKYLPDAIPDVYALQIEIEWATSVQLGADDFCPIYAEVDYQENIKRR